MSIGHGESQEPTSLSCLVSSLSVEAESTRHSTVRRTESLRSRAEVRAPCSLSLVVHLLGAQMGTRL